MKTHQQNPDWHQLGLWEYMLLANPSEEVHWQVMEEKKYFGHKYDADIATKTLPNITIANFLAKEMMEDTMCRWIQSVCAQQYSFTVTLNNFSGFPTHAIFIRVQNAQPFKVLTQRLNVLDDLLKTNGCPPLQVVTKPHLSIARQLSRDLYDEAIKEYAQRSFYEVFTLDKLVLLKRDSRYKKWEHVNYFYLPPERNLFN